MAAKHDHNRFIDGIELYIASIAVQPFGAVPEHLTTPKRQYLQAPGNGMSNKLQSSPSEASELPETLTGPMEQFDDQKLCGFDHSKNRDMKIESINMGSSRFYE